MSYPAPLKSDAITTALADFIEHEVLYAKAAMLYRDGYIIYLEKSIKNSKKGMHDAEEYRQNSLAHKLFLQIEIARSVDSFQKYISDFLSEIFKQHPQTFFKRKIDISDIFSATSLEEFRRDIIDQQVNELSYKGVSELAIFIKEKTGFDLFPKKVMYGRISRLFETRNCIVHNRGRVDQKFLNNTGNRRLIIGDFVSAPQSNFIRKYLFICATELDDRAVKKFSFPEAVLIKRKLMDV